MPSALSVTFAVLGTIAGLCYAGLGIAALSHMPASDEHDRVGSWSLWWWLERGKYDEEGKRLCRKGAWVFAFGTACWVVSAYFW